MIYGIGYGVGFDVYELLFLDFKGFVFLVGEVLIVELGFYCVDMGGVWVEDMVIVIENGCENFN